jgi:hypothetical protein
LWLHKDGWNNKPFTISAKYYNNRDDEHCCEFKIHEIIEKFNEENVENYEEGTWNNSTGFSSKEECQKYCDWLNNRVNKNNEEN